MNRLNVTFMHVNDEARGCGREMPMAATLTAKKDWSFAI